MSTITKELIENILQFNSEGSDCPANAEQWEVHELARIALASLEAEPVAYMTYKGYLLHAADPKLAEYSEPTPLYDTPPAPVSVPDEIPKLKDGRGFKYVKDRVRYSVNYANGWNACRAAMLQGAEPVTTVYKLPDDFICMLTGRAKYLREKGEIKSPELLERAAAALQGESVNTSSIPDGWKLVPIDPTKDMLRAGQSVVGFWLNTVHCYSKMLAAAPAAPQQEVNNGN